ncbi:choice-of-anchor I family protein [Nocardioidaceae bacterium]|nr:choice-of-anchor I family protein [Nocardioidaceae bacterium]
MRTSERRGRRLGLAAAAIATSSALALSGATTSASAADGADLGDVPAVERGASSAGSVLGTYASGFFDAGVAEIVAHAPRLQRVFTVNSGAGTLDVLDVADPTAPTKVGEIATPGANSVAVRRNLLVVAQQAKTKTDRGTLAFFNARTLKPLARVRAGALPDMVTFSADGRYVIAANEGEPEGYCAGQVDPVGSVTIVRLPAQRKKLRVTQVGFGQFNGVAGALERAGVRLFGPGASVAQDLEPEYITTTGGFAFVTLQENNAIAVVDLKRGRVVTLVPLGTENHAVPGHGIDASDRDDAIDIATRPVKGLRLPDAIAAFRAAGQSYLITANEGDAREYACLLDDSGEEQAEDARIGDLTLAPTVFPTAADLQNDENLGRLGVSLLTSPSYTDAEGGTVYTGLESLGTRSATIFSVAGEKVWDSGDLFEQVTAAATPGIFNADNAEQDSFDGRSDNKGPEPEGVVTGVVGDRTYAFVGLERHSGIVVLDVSDPREPAYVDLLVNRDLTVGDTEPGEDDPTAVGDLGPEGLAFVAAGDSPTGQPLLIVGNEVSGTTTIWGLDLG